MIIHVELPVERDRGPMCWGCQFWYERTDIIFFGTEYCNWQNGGLFSLCTRNFRADNKLENWGWVHEKKRTRRNKQYYAKYKFGERKQVNWLRCYEYLFWVVIMWLR